jgi:hypothetical protein
MTGDQMAQKGFPSARNSGPDFSPAANRNEADAPFKAEAFSLHTAFRFTANAINFFSFSNHPGKKYFALRILRHQ